ncbi:MAG: hypothetical protein DRH70_09145 [Candidatus Coatesbacteria bacterium]|nr:MAG: hypothetical protein DRH70_09145 [Candidatus Coatesbacteria bacterium]
MAGEAGRLAKFLWTYKLGRTRLSYGPIFVWLEPTNRCNLRCPLCPTGEGLGRKRGEMTMDLFRHILEKLNEAPPLLLTLHLAGEPLLAGNIFEMIRLAKEAGVQTTLSTNATLLSPEMSRRLIQAGLDSIRLDFSASRETFEKVRLGASWEKVYANILGLLKAKAELNVQRPIVRIKEVSLPSASHRERVRAMRELKSLFHGFPVKGFSSLEIHNWAGAFATEHEDLGEAHRRRRGLRPCSHLWTSLAITYDGLVVPCCRDLEAECVVGDLKTQSLMDIWNGEKLRAMREAMVKRDVGHVALCAKCSRLYQNPRFVFYTFGFIYMRLDQLFSGIVRALSKPRR